MGLPFMTCICCSLILIADHDTPIRTAIKRVQDLMQVRDMNLYVLAKKCGISYSTIQTTARRGGQLSVETIERICQGLGITLKDFFDSSYL